jgi:hypothetical protein
MSGGENNELDPYPFVKLAQSGLPPRVRGLLEGAYQAAQPVIEGALTSALDALERDLLAHAERASNAAEQNQCFASVREFRLRRADFMLACRAGVQRSMLASIDPSVHDETLKIVTIREAEGHPGAVEVAGREDDLTLSQIATRAEIRASNELQALAYRFGVIIGSPPIEIEKLALGPYKLCAAIRAAARRFEVFPPHRLALYRRIDKALFAQPRGLYDAVNGYLIDHRVFANLQLMPQSDDAIEPSTDVATGASAIQPAPDRTAPVREPVADLPPKRPAAAQPPAPMQLPQPSMQAVAPTERQARADAPLDADFFRRLRDRLASVRRDQPAAIADAEPQRPLADRSELLLALSRMQAQPSARGMLGGESADRVAGQIRQDLLNQLRSRVDGRPPRLRDEDSDTIDVIGLLFGQLLQAYRPNSVSRDIVGRLQIPLLKAALRDPGLFTRPAHPARRFVDAIVDCLADWVDDEDTDRQVVEKLRMVVDRLIREFDEDVACFDRCLDEVEKHVAGLRRKAEVAERRHVEAAKGREKLDLARAAAEETVQQQLSQSRVPTAIRELLENTWADAIALALLRQGVDHPKTHERVAMVDQLLQVFGTAQDPHAQHAMLDYLRPVLEDGLAAVGFHDDAIMSAWNDLCALIDARHEQEQLHATRAITELIRQKPRFGGDSALPAGGADAMPLAIHGDDTALNPSERAMVERISQLSPGTWIEFTPERGANACRRRLSWYSPATGRCMLLNVRGARCEDRSIVQLAREMLHGSARLAPKDREPPTDRAWRAIDAELRERRPGAAPPQPAPIR